MRHILIWSCKSPFNMQKVLITAASGNIGARLIPNLLATKTIELNCLYSVPRRVLLLSKDQFRTRDGSKHSSNLTKSTQCFFAFLGSTRYSLFSISSMPCSALQASSTLCEYARIRKLLGDFHSIMARHNVYIVRQVLLSMRWLHRQDWACD
jgi:hypothetical protein